MSIAGEIVAAVRNGGEVLGEGDVVVVAQKIVSKAEGRLVRLSDVQPGAAAHELAAKTGREPEMAQLILDESSDILRATPAAIIARQTTGHVLANAGIDASNVEGGEEGTVLLWPLDPDASARAIRAAYRRAVRHAPGGGDCRQPRQGMADRHGRRGDRLRGSDGARRPARQGEDLFGRTLQATVIAIADAVSAAAVLAMGEGAEGTPAALVRGAGRWVSAEDGPGAASGLRPVAEDMFR